MVKKIFGDPRNFGGSDATNELYNKQEKIVKIFCLFTFQNRWLRCDELVMSKGLDELWCATSVDANLDMIQWGFCSGLCPNQNFSCDILQIYYSEDPNNYHDFIQQSGVINERPFYFSINKEIIWWSNTAKSWMCHAYNENGLTFQPIFQIKKNLRSLNLSNKSNWTILRKDDKIIKSRCVKINRCLAAKEKKGNV